MLRPRGGRVRGAGRRGRKVSLGVPQVRRQLLCVGAHFILLSYKRRPNFGLLPAARLVPKNRRRRSWRRRHSGPAKRRIRQDGYPPFLHQRRGLVDGDR